MIPVQNVYYLLLYAWDALEQSDIGSLDAVPQAQVLDLLAGVLNQGTDRLLRQGLYRAYVSRKETIPGIRGKLDFSATTKADLLNRAQAVCEFDELSHDILPNRILKATIWKLLQTDGLDTKLSEPLRSTWHCLHEVTTIHLTNRTFRAVQFHRENRVYRFLIDVCRLLHNCLIPAERSGQFMFRNFVRNERSMRVLFERFIRNFYRHHAEGFESIDSEILQWKDATGPTADLVFLPKMRTDISLRRPGLVLVIDAKYYLNPLQEYRGHTTIRSTHLYQLFAYLTNITSKADPKPEIEGMLIYPLTTRRLNLEMRIQGYRIRVITLDLNQKWSHIHSDLLEMLPKQQSARL